MKLRELPAEQLQQGAIKNRYDDLTILSRFIYLIKLANQLKQHDNSRAMDIDLEMGLMQFTSMFKSSVFGDPRIILLGATAREESIGQRKDSNESGSGDQERAVSYSEKIDTETRTSHDALAQMMENEDMSTILNFFAEKILLNLVYSSQSAENSSRIIDATLSVFSFYTGSLTSCRLIGQTAIMK